MDEDVREIKQEFNVMETDSSELLWERSTTSPDSGCSETWGPLANTSEIDINKEESAPGTGKITDTSCSDVRSR